MGRKKTLSGRYAKRQRVDQNPNNSSGGSRLLETDYFDFIAQNELEDSNNSARPEVSWSGDTTTITERSIVVSSWLCNPSCFNDFSSLWDEDSNSGCTLDDGEDEDSMSLKSRLRADIDSLSRQLLLVKRKLLPAAELCAERCSMNEPIHSRSHPASALSSRDVFNMARSQCNPFEILGERKRGGLAHRLFLNRAAVKLTNIDALLNFALTNRNNVGDDGRDPFVFVDLCGAPGGFSEYVMMKRRQRRQQTSDSSPCYGYGMSLIGSNEHGEGTPWKIKSRQASNSMSKDEAEYRGDDFDQETYTIFSGVDGTGDVFRWDNVEALLNLMKDDYTNNYRRRKPEEAEFSSMDCTDEDEAEQAKAHLVMADGGFDAQRDSEDQEAMAQKLVVCEVAAALSLLRIGGTLVIKMFGFQTCVVRAVLMDLHLKFADMVALKPISSRPASAERYLVCRDFRGLGAEWKGGPNWRNKMFLGMNPTTTATTNGERLSLYFDTFERDLLRLNLKSCFSILTFLENKQPSQSSNSDESQWDDHLSPSLKVDIASYRRAWQLSNI